MRPAIVADHLHPPVEVTRFDPEFLDGAVRIVKRDRPSPSGGSCGRELGVNEGALGNWVRRDQAGQAGGLTVDERTELARLHKRVAELEMERDMLKRSVGLWVNEATR